MIFARRLVSAAFIAAIAVIVVVARPGRAEADTIIAGGNVINQTWTPAGSPYILNGDITVPAGASLTIQAGVEVRVASSDGQMAGLSTSRVEITVQGSLAVNGTAGSPVGFRGVSASAGTWYGIVVGAMATEATIGHATVQHAIHGVHSQNAGAVLEIANTTISSCSQNGLFLAAGATQLVDVTVAQNSVNGVLLQGASSATMTRLVSRANAQQGVRFEPTSAGTMLVIDHATIHANGEYGVYTVGSAAGAVTITSSVITQNDYGVVRGDSSSVTTTFTNVWNNQFANFSGASAGTACISSNPLYVSGTNLRLTSNSPARFGAADASDMGALAFVSDATVGLQGVLWSGTTLSVAASPHTVLGDLTVPKTVTLTIEPGATVNFAASDSMLAGVSTSRSELAVEGTLSAAGTPALPIVLGGVSASAGTWYGVRIAAGATSSSLEQLTIRHAIIGLWIESTAASNGFTDLTTQNCSQHGVQVSGGAPLITRLVSHSNSVNGVLVTGSASLTLQHPVLRANAQQGVRFEPNVGGRALILDHATIHANGEYGVYTVGSAAGAVTITSSVITQNDYGVVRGDSSSVTTTFTNVWNNQFANFSGASAGTACISSNPLYVSGTNLRLTSNSPARFGAADASDMGALAYTTDATPGLHGKLWVDTTLSAAGSPYTVAGDLTVATGVTLKVDPGVTVSFAASDLMLAGVSTSRTELAVEGVLLAAGTPALPIVFAGVSASAGTWHGVRLAPSAVSSTLAHLTIRHGIVGLWLEATASSNTYHFLTLHNCSQNGLQVTAGTPTIDAFTSHSNSVNGVLVSGSASATLTNAVIRANAQQGVRFEPSVGGRTLVLTHASIHVNGEYGVYTVGSAAGTVTILNSIITQNDYGVVRGDSSTVTTTFSDVWNNQFANFSGAVAGAGCISQNPQYVSSTDLRLMSSSVCIDAGTTSLVDHDRDGVSRPLEGNGLGGPVADMGAHEFVLMAMCGNGSIEPGEVCDSGAANGMYGACKADCTGLGPRCGDSMMNGPEACDDGNASNTDACLTTCVAASCGDGFVRASIEACDDGNDVDTDACLDTCVAASCGDGFVHAGIEACDDGNGANTDACLNSCVAASCGDGIVHGGVEACDDMNGANTDTCLNTCVAASCGDGFVRAGSETCDDGNSSNTDACVGACVGASCGDGFVQAGVESCDDGNMINTDACSNSCTAPQCGDGVTQPGEECDDADLDNTDACLNNCKNAVCGDGVKQAGVEACDDGDLDNSDACTANCVAAACGDGFVQTGVETCDDGNVSNTDACVTGCLDAACGDGFVRAGVEACDDGNQVDTDGCSNACALPGCGDGVVQGVEACDDGNASNTDACLSSCLAASCGDSFVHAGTEECDDENVMDGDGCSASCTIEAMLPDAGPGGTPDAGPDAPDAGGGGTPDAGGGEEPPGDGGGCGCRASGASGPSSAGSWLLAALVALVVRRRRRRRGA